MRTLEKSSINSMKSDYSKLEKDTLSEVLATIIYFLSRNGISVDITELNPKWKECVDNEFLREAVEELNKKPVHEKIRINYSKHDDDVLLEFIHKVKKMD